MSESNVPTGHVSARGVLAVLLIVVLGGGCSKPEYSWAFAQNLDGSFRPNETCRESLAQSLFADANRDKTMREGDTNIFLFSGAVDRYRIYAFKAQGECETVLTNMTLRQTLRDLPR